jgi:hypothetical protein
MRLARWRARRTPGLARLRDRLVRPSLILAPQRDTDRFCDTVGQVDQPLFLSVFGSVTVTTPAFRFRCAVPVGHHVRVRWYELPASCSTRRMVLVPTCGNPVWRKLRWSALRDQVAMCHPCVDQAGVAR